MASNYTTRRYAARNATNSRSWSRNRNLVRHESKVKLGPISTTFTLGALVLLFGIFFLTQSTAVTTYDMNIAETNREITELQAQKEALAVENAKINSAAADEDTNAVASTMEDAGIAEFAQ